MANHQHRYNPATDQCEVEGCERVRPDWLDPEAIAASPATHTPTATKTSLLAWKMTPAKYAIIMIALVIVTHLGARAWGAHISQETNTNGNSPVVVNVR